MEGLKNLPFARQLFSDPHGRHGREVRQRDCANWKPRKLHQGGNLAARDDVAGQRAVEHAREVVNGSQPFAKHKRCSITRSQRQRLKRNRPWVWEQRTSSATHYPSKGGAGKTRHSLSRVEVRPRRHSGAKGQPFSKKLKGQKGQCVQPTSSLKSDLETHHTEWL